MILFTRSSTGTVTIATTTTCILLLLLLLATNLFHPVSASQGDYERYPVHQKPLDVGDRNRFWRHHVTEQSLVHDGINHYHNIQNCIVDTLGDDIMEQINTVTSTTRTPGQTYYDPVEGNILLIVIKDAMHPLHVQAVQTVASCVRKYLPHLYESRAMYQEMDLDEDDGYGGNCPTHLAPLVGIFLPQVIKEMDSTLQLAYETAGWKAIVDKEQPSRFMLRQKKLFPPEQVGIRASEHLTYNDFPSLAEHDDGDTCYTMNFAFSGPDDYVGGEFFILARDERGREVKRHFVKPNRYEAMVFLGGRYLHGVNEITGGHREMFSTEFWGYPDTPFGSNLWSNYPTNMENHIEACNEEIKQGNTGPCKAKFGTSTPFHDDMTEVRSKYGNNDEKKTTSNEENKAHDLFKDYPPPLEGINRSKDDRERPNRIRPSELKAVDVIFSDRQGNQISLSEFYSREEEPDFLIPKHLEPGQMVPIRWREDLTPIDGPDGESFVIGFPKELNQEFKTYIEKNGMMRVAHELLYKSEPIEAGDQRIYTLDDGEKWTAMVQGTWDNDMIWLDPGDESAFESLLGVLRRGGFDLVLDQLAKAFDLDGLMIQGVGAIFLSENQRTDNIHVDIVGSRGSFYNIIVPVYIPKDDVSIFKLSDKGDDVEGSLRLDPNVGVILGGESQHGTGECNYRKNEDFRLSFAVYVADIKDENIELIASDSTSLWPTSGDTFWFAAQKGRLWTRDGKNSLKNDKGRKPMNVQDKSEKCATMDKALCMTDLQGMRLECPKTCELYLEDDIYYAKYFPNSSLASPTDCKEDGTHPTCPNTATA